MIVDTTIDTYIKTIDWYFAGTVWSWLGVVLTAILIGIGIFIIADDCPYPYSDIIKGGICLFIMAIGIIGFTFFHPTMQEYPVYKYVITEETKMKEFYEKYEVIRNDGWIYTVRERDYKEQNYE